MPKVCHARSGAYHPLYRYLHFDCRYRWNWRLPRILILTQFAYWESPWSLWTPWDSPAWTSPSTWLYSGTRCANRSKSKLLERSESFPCALLLEYGLRDTGLNDLIKVWWLRKAQAFGWYMIVCFLPFRLVGHAPLKCLSLNLVSNRELYYQTRSRKSSPCAQDPLSPKVRLWCSGLPC